MRESRVIAIRAGLWLLLVSCGLGMLVTLAGEVNLANGRPPEVWGEAGILKYPHGAALHAIRTLPLRSAMLQKFRGAHSAWLIRSAVAAYLLFLIHALWQTFHGRARLEVDLTSFAALALAGLLLLLPIVAIVRGTAVMARAYLTAGRSLQRSIPARGPDLAPSAVLRASIHRCECSSAPRVTAHPPR